MDISSILPFKELIVTGKVVNDKMIFFIYKDSEETRTQMHAVLVTRTDEDGATVRKSMAFEIPESSDYACWTSDDGKELLFAYKPDVAIIVEGTPQKDQGVMFRHTDGDIDQKLVINFDRTDGINPDLMWMMKDGPRDFNSSDMGDTAGMSEEEIERIKAQMDKPEPVYGKKGGLKGVKTKDGKFHRIDVPYEERKKYM